MVLLPPGAAAAAACCAHEEHDDEHERGDHGEDEKPVNGEPNAEQDDREQCEQYQEKQL